MSKGKQPNKQPSKLARWKDAVNYDIRAKDNNWLRFLKRDTAIVTPTEIQILESAGFMVQYKGRESGMRSRVKAVGVQAVVQAIRMKEDLQKVVRAVQNREWTTVTRLVQPMGLPVDYTPRSNKQQKKVLANV